MRLKTDEEEIWEGMRTLIVVFLVLLVSGLFVLSILDLQYELLGMQIAYTAALISLPLFLAAVVILSIGHWKFRDDIPPAGDVQANRK